MDVSESIQKIRGIQRQLERIAKRQQVDDLAHKPQVEQKLVYIELLELCRELKWEFTEVTGPAKARTCMNLCLLLLYCSVNPGRAKKYITLHTYKNQSTDKCRDQNFIYFHKDGSDQPRKCLQNKRNIEHESDRLNILKFSDVLPENLLYQNATLAAYQSYNNYTLAFDKYFSLKLTTVDLRKTVINHFLTLPESSDYSLRESFAALMKHSVWSQKQFYDEWLLAEKKGNQSIF